MPKVAALLFLIPLLALRAIAEEAQPEAAPAWTAAQRDAALERAFAYLDDNLWKLGDYGSSKRYAAAVAGWAYLLAAERSGKRLPCRAKQLRRIRGNLERHLEMIERGYDRFDKDGRWPMGKRSGVPDPALPRDAQITWAFSMAALFFAESMARGEDRRHSEHVLGRIVAVLERCQHPSGGWGHGDARVPGLRVGDSVLHRLRGYPPTLVGATSCVASALGTAHRLLNTPEPRSVPLAIRYFREAQYLDGTFPYSLRRKRTAGQPAQRAGPDLSVVERARTAGALYALYCLGARHDRDPIPKAAAVVGGSLEEVGEGHGSATLSLQLGALLSRAQGEARWNAFREIYFPRILAAQDRNGSFGCICRHEADAVTCDSEPHTSGLGTMPGYRERLERKRGVYVTAIHCLILLLDRSPSRVAPPVPAASVPITPRQE